jgi:hypothetical protein
MKRAVQNAQKAGVLLVTLPEEMPTTETLELHAAIRNELDLPVCGLVVNQTQPVLFDPAERGLLHELASSLRDASPLLPLARGSRARAEREHIQRTSLERLAKIRPSVSLPLLLTDDLRRREIDQLGQKLASDFAAQS